MKYGLQPFDSRKSASSPALALGKEAIRLVVSEVQRVDRRVDLVFHASYMLPDQVAGRFHDLNTALVLVLTDVDARDGFAVRTIDDFIKYPPGEGPPERNLKAPPPLPLAPRGDPSGSSYTGGYLSCGLWFETAAHPIHRPSAFLYLLLENYVSNTVGLDLIAQSAVTF